METYRVSIMYDAEVNASDEFDAIDIFFGSI